MISSSTLVTTEADVQESIEDASTIPATFLKDEAERTAELAWIVGVAWTAGLLRSG
jgi:hypothetical protein